MSAVGVLVTGRSGRRLARRRALAAAATCARGLRGPTLPVGLGGRAGAGAGGGLQPGLGQRGRQRAGGGKGDQRRPHPGRTGPGDRRRTARLITRDFTAGQRDGDVVRRRLSRHREWREGRPASPGRSGSDRAGRLAIAFRQMVSSAGRHRQELRGRRRRQRHLHVGHRQRVGRLERQPSRQGVVQHHTHRIQIAARVQRFGPGLLGREVVGRADHRARQRDPTQLRAELVAIGAPAGSDAGGKSISLAMPKSQTLATSTGCPSSPGS